APMPIFSVFHLQPNAVHHSSFRRQSSLPRSFTLMTANSISRSIPEIQCCVGGSICSATVALRILPRFRHAPQGTVRHVENPQGRRSAVVSCIPAVLQARRGPVGWTASPPCRRSAVAERGLSIATVRGSMPAASTEAGILQPKHRCKHHVTMLFTKPLFFQS